ncbi:oligosaccharide flippase family protein [Spongiimicrobium sp. 3-5]|uniref:oligosaccharide flippase family protein n=1 Tax=Spongiimicrobium sp. 3-5 TaxID=3332596 RepID=UPI0039802428
MLLTNKNILANIVGRGWSMFSVFVFIPIYIAILGIKMYGVISFYAVLQGILIFADAGLTATLRRELAKGDASVESRKKKYKILRSIEFAYFLIVFGIVLFTFLFSDFIVQNWLNIEDLDMQSTKRSIQIMGLALGLNFLSTLYQGGLLGMEKQVKANTFQIIWSLLKNGGVIVVILLIDKALTTFFLWQAAINLLYALLLRYVLLSSLKGKQIFRWKFTEDIKILKTVWRYATGMLIISIIAAINSQFDKLIVSNLFSVSDLGIYTVAYSLAMVPVILSGPIATAIFPRLVNFFDQKSKKQLIKIFNNSFVLVLLLASSAGIVLALNANLFLMLWTQNHEIANLATLPARFLLLGQVLLAFQIIPFNLALAKGNTKITILSGSAGLLILIPMVIFMAKNYGMSGAAFSWFITSIIMTPIYIVLVLKKTMNFQIVKWFLVYLIKPFGIIVSGNLFFYLVKPSIISKPLFGLIYITITSFLVLLISFNIVFNIKIKNTLKFIQNELFA